MTRNQWLAITLAVLGVTMAATSQLTDLFGPKVAHSIVTVAGLANSLLAAILGVLTSASGQVKDVQNMPGVEKITVNAKADEALATLAVDPNQLKIEATPQAESAVQATAARSSS